MHWDGVQKIARSFPSSTKRAARDARDDTEHRPQPFAIFGRWVSRSATFDLNENYLKSVAAL
jgi:hypothetical protein